MITILELISFFPLLLLNCLWIIGFYVACDCETEKRFEQIDVNTTKKYYICTDEGSKMILWRIKLFCLNTFGEFYSKPICTCPPCMASIHSLWYLAFMPFNLHFLALYPLYIVALCGLNYLVVKKFDL